MGETDLHRSIMMAIIEMLKDYYRDHPDVYVSGNLFIYYEPGVPASSFSPDAFVVFGVPKRDRRTYKFWEENGKAPDVVFEVTSKSTWLEDEGAKMALCRRLGVREYFLFDPLEEYLVPALQGYRLHRGQYLPIQAGPAGELDSQALGLTLKEEKQNLRMILTATGEALLTPSEAQAARRQAETEVARLRDELEKLKSKNA